MITLKKPISRRTADTLDGSFGKDRNKTLAVTLIPGKDGVDDLLELRPYGTRRAERIALCDVYRYAIRARVNRGNLERANAAKIKKQAAREQRALDRAARKLRQPIDL